MHVNLKVIARMAGVSTATVSRVINNKAVGNMKRETFERIKKIIEATDYRPDALAAGLRRGSTNLIGVILPDTVNPYYAQLGSFIGREAFRHGFLTLVCNSAAETAREKDYVKHLISQRVAGILLCSTGLPAKELEPLLLAKSRVILLDEDVEDFDGNAVIGDDYLGGWKGADYLHSLGHSEILVIIGPEKLNSVRNRLRGFCDFKDKRTGGCDLDLVVSGDFTIESSYRELSAALGKGLKATAVFAFNDLMAIGAIKALMDKGYRVPQDMSVLGYDNIFIDELMNPKITTVATPLDLLAEKAVRLIVEGADRKGEKLLLEPKILVRDSCQARRKEP